MAVQIRWYLRLEVTKQEVIGLGRDQGATKR